MTLLTDVKQDYKLLLLVANDMCSLACEIDKERFLLANVFSLDSHYHYTKMLDMMISNEHCLDDLVVLEQTPIGAVAFDFIGNEEFLNKALFTYPEWFM